MNTTSKSQDDGISETQNQIEDGIFTDTQMEPTLRYGVDTMPPLSVAFLLAFQKVTIWLASFSGKGIASFLDLAINLFIQLYESILHTQRTRDGFEYLRFSVLHLKIHVIMAFTGCIMISLTLSDLACADINDPIRAKLFCSSVFLVGITTIAQNAVGIRLPVFQGVSGAFIAPLLSMKTSGTWACTDQHTAFNMSYGNATNMTSENLLESTEYDQEAVYNRVRELQGSLMLASLLEILLGATGLIGRLLQFIGPIPVSVTLMSLGLMLYPVAIQYCSTFFPVAIGGILLMILFILYIPHVTIPLPSMASCKKNNKKTHERSHLPVFRVFPILLTLLLTSAVCGVLTETGVFPDDKSHSTYRARTDSRLPLINLTPWFFFPYPGQFGSPGFNTAVFIGFLTAFIASAIESVGDYIAISRATETYPPPMHAINRGILTEGAMSMLSGAMGVGHATTSISDNIVIVKITRIASRGVLVIAGCLATVFGVIGKVGAIMTSLPDPGIGGVLFFQLGMLVSIGLSMLQNVNIKSSRNLAVIGISIYTGLVLSEWIKANPHSFDTGVRQADQVLKTVLGTPMFTSGIVAIVLDNTVRGSKSDRGLPDQEPVEVALTSYNRRVYNVPMVTRWQTHWRWLRHLPFLQPYSDQE